MKLTDRLAERLWSGEVKTADPHYSAGNLTGGVRKQDGERHGQVPDHIMTPFRGKPRPFNPFSLRILADTEAVQSAIDHIIADLKAIQGGVAPTDPDLQVAEDVQSVTEDHLQSISPNDESRGDVDEMLWRDLLEVGNCIAVKNYQIDGRRVEVNPLDPNTFTVGWDSHRVITAFWQYPNSSQGYWGRPERFDPEDVIWETLGKETSRAGIYGHSPVEKLQRVINIIGGLMDNEERELEEGMPPGIVSLVGDWSDEDYNRFEDYWENNVKGEQHKVPLAKGEATFEPFQSSYSDLEILDRQQWYFKLVGAIFKVPVSENGLAIGEEMTRATDVSQRQRYKQKTINSMLTQREQTWTKDFIQAHFTENLEFRYDPGLDLMEKKELVSMATTLVQNGVYSINEGREMLGKDPQDWGEGPPPAMEGGGQDQDGGPPGMGQSTEADNQEALSEGLTPMMETEEEIAERQSKDFSGPQGSSCCSGVPVGKPFGPWQDFEDCVEHFIQEGDDRETARRKCGELQEELKQESLEEKAKRIAKEREMSIEDTPFRQGQDYQEFSFQPKEIEALLADLSDVFRKKIQEVMDDIKGNQGGWTAPDQHDSGDVKKSLQEYMRLIEEDISVDFSKELGEVLATHKGRKILEGKDSIMEELEQAGLDPEDIQVEDFEDKIARRIERRTMETTKEVSRRMRKEVQETIQEGWEEGKTITDIERDIESLTDKWQGTDAERLARDQMGKAAKEGRLEFAKETEEEVGGWMKTWMTNIDGRQREAHRRMDGETVPRDDPFVVNYTPQGGPARVEEDYPGASKWGIQCRCDYELVPKETVEKLRDWGESVSSRAREEVKKQYDGQEVWKVLLMKELQVQRGTLSRSKAWEQMGLGSKATYYKWIEQSGLKGAL